MNTYVVTRLSKWDWWLVYTDCPVSRFHSLLIDYVRSVNDDKEPPFNWLDYIRSKWFEAKVLKNNYAIEFLNRNNLKKEDLPNYIFQNIPF